MKHPHYPWIYIHHAPWDGKDYLLTDGIHRWISSRQKGKSRNGQPTTGHEFGRPDGARFPTHFAMLPNVPEES